MVQLKVKVKNVSFWEMNSYVCICYSIIKAYKLITIEKDMTPEGYQLLPLPIFKNLKQKKSMWAIMIYV